jgi:hypothetical protein
MRRWSVAGRNGEIGACPALDFLHDLAFAGRTMLDYDNLAGEYAKHRDIHPGVLRGLLSMGGLTESSRVLEIGCGPGN